MIEEADADPFLHWPATWPGQQVVDLDNLGDPGIWLDDRLPDIADILSSTDSTLQSVAASLADDYLIAAAEMLFPIPSDFGLTPDECHATIALEFHAFLTEWKLRLVQRHPPNFADHSRFRT